MSAADRDGENIFAEERRQLIAEMVDKNVKTTVGELCEQFGVSAATIRGDLRELEQAGRLRRTHGGAITNRRANYEPNAYEKESERIKQKKLITQAAASYVRDGNTIALDTGSTMFALAKQLVDIDNLTVVTNDLQIAAYLERYSGARIVLAGGTVRRDFHCTVGQKALDSVTGLNVDRTFLAANGVSLQRGLTTPNIDVAYMKTKLASLADEVILVADSSKIGKVSFVKFADLEDVQVLVTDSGADEDYLEAVREAGISVNVCPGT